MSSDPIALNIGMGRMMAVVLADAELARYLCLLKVVMAITEALCYARRQSPEFLCEQAISKR